MEISWEFGGAENKDIVIPTSPDFISPFLPSQLHCQNFDHQHWLTGPAISFSSSPCILFVTQLNFHLLISLWIWLGWIGKVSTYLLGLQSCWFSQSLGQIFFTKFHNCIWASISLVHKNLMFLAVFSLFIKCLPTRIFFSQ